ncbi:MAG: 2-oxo-4-hydroxy-4-carboxy-5-ureidoimidazoline decarboxylase [Acidobacteriaceae bacterium]|nr:2-oxo-4-hydroxy-4-carboxy-5-ureidoimidazoline decarboxylase [Acidobacteriaceae bacterium]
MIPVADLNRLPFEEFVVAVGWVFEHSPWVAERAWSARPFSGVEHLHREMVWAVEGASREEQLALLREHPDLGTRARMSASSSSEQAGAGLDALSAEEFERLQRLNRAYREKFGFPFLLAVKGADKTQILNALSLRYHAAAKDEFREALQQVYRIARFRLQDTIKDA